MHNCIIGSKEIDLAEKDTRYVQSVNDAVTMNGKYPERLISQNVVRIVDLYYISQMLDLKPTDTVLEVGAWDNFSFSYISKFCKNIIASDSFTWGDRGYKLGLNSATSEWIKTAETYPNTTVMKMDIQELSSHNIHVDKLYSISVLEHVEKDLLGLKEMFNVLNPGGLCVFSTEINLFTDMPYRSDIHFRVYRPEQVIMLARLAGFEIDSFYNVPDKEDPIYKKMEVAKGKPDLLIYPYQHFGVGVFCLRKPS